MVRRGAQRRRPPGEQFEVGRRACGQIPIPPFDNAAARDYATIRDHLFSAGQPIGPNDMLIAAIARTHGAALITHNVAEFSRVPGLTIDDWQS
jgi:tRNA(fMet)-specific endonuclease VapC